MTTEDIQIQFEYRSDYSSYAAMAAECGFDNINYCTEYFSGIDVNVYPGARYDLKASMYLGIPATYTRTVTQWAMPVETRKLTRKYQRSATQTVRGTAAMTRFEGFCRSLAQTVRNTMTTKGLLAMLRELSQQTGAGATLGRVLSMTRKQQDTAHSETVSLWHLFVFLRIITGTFIRDFIILRFLKSREELVIKSTVRREITLGSRLH